MGSDVLITGSLAWLIIWSFVGMKAGKNHPEWLEKIKGISQEGNLGKFWSTYDGFMIQKTGHAHANSLACVTFIIGLAMKVDIIGFSVQLQTILAIWFLVGVVLAGFGDRLRVVPLAAAGGILYLTGLIASFIGLFV